MDKQDMVAITELAYRSAQKYPYKSALMLGGYTGEFAVRGSSTFYQCTNGCDPEGHLDKCAINEDANMGHCFKCGEGWDSAKVVAQMLEIPYEKATLLIAREQGVINDAMFDQMVQLDLGKFKKTKPVVEQKKKKEFRRDDVGCDLVYRHMLALPEFRLSDEHRQYLRKKRNLTDKEIDSIGFFTYGNRFEMKDLLASIRKEQPDFSSSQMWGISGFYMVFVNDEKTKGYWEFRKPYGNCIGIPLRNAKREIIALQMLSLSPNTSAKYFFVTSKSAGKEEDNIGYGTSCGSPAHVEYPEVITNSLFVIGEGMFKMHEMAKEGSIAFSCQGVTNYASAVDAIDQVLQSNTAKERLHESLRQSNKPMLHFAICYDADMYDNVGVLEAAMKLCKALKKKYPKVGISYLLWDKAEGKGFDDLKENCIKKGIDYHDRCFTIDSDTFMHYAQDSIEYAQSKVVEKYGKMTKGKIRATDEFKSELANQLWTNRVSKHAHY